MALTIAIPLLHSVHTQAFAIPVGYIVVVHALYVVHVWAHPRSWRTGEEQLDALHARERVERQRRERIAASKQCGRTKEPDGKR